MRTQIRLDVFSDYLWPWCYNAAVRLDSIKHIYGDQVQIHWRTFPLIPDQRPGRRCTPRTQEGRQRAAAEEPGALFVLPPLNSDLPASSLPALTAVKCAERQGKALLETLHQRLFVAHFHDHLDISRPDVLWRLARESGLDMACFQKDSSTGEAYQAVLHDYAEGAAWFGVSALPTVIFNEKVSLIGAVAEERYHLLLDWMLAGEPGGLLPLDVNPPDKGATGQSVISQA